MFNILFIVVGFLKEGVNKLKIKIINLWPNRIIGDLNLPEAERKVKTNVIKFKATGHVKKDYNWVAYITLTDFEVPAEVIDGARIILEHPTSTFDTSEGYFTSDHVFPGCTEDKITKVDAGNLRMR